MSCGIATSPRPSCHVPIDANKRSVSCVCTVGICNRRDYTGSKSPACVAGSLRDVSFFSFPFVLFFNRVARCALIVPKRRGVTRCASRSRLSLRESVRGSDEGGRKKKHERFISDGRQLFRSPQRVYFFFFPPTSLFPES